MSAEPKHPRPFIRGSPAHDGMSERVSYRARVGVYGHAKRRACPRFQRSQLCLRLTHEIQAFSA
jgi:hypothetical protein